MDMSLQTFIFMWITVGCLSQPENSETSNNLPVHCDFVSKNVCLKFVEESKTWDQASSSCAKKGGKLLKVLSNSVKIYLSNITRENNTSNLTWWMGERVHVNQRPSLKNDDVSKDFCTYIKLNPLQLLTSNCRMKRGFLCIHRGWKSPSRTKQTIIPGHQVRSRHKRNTDKLNYYLDGMVSNVNNISVLLQFADKALRIMEKQPGEPTNDKRAKFIGALLNGTKTLTKDDVSENKSIVADIISCSTAMMRLSQKKCDTDSNPNPISLFETLFEIIRIASLLTGLEINQTYITRTLTSTLYMRTVKPDGLDNALVGSKEDGFVKLPSFSALQSKVGGFDSVTAQMATFPSNPHPSDDNISGSVCNFILSDGADEIRLENLTEMIEIFLTRPKHAGFMNSTVELTKDTKSVSTLNISDPQMTVFFSVEPSVNVSLLLTLSYGSPPNSTYFSNTTILSHTGGYRWMITPEMFQQNSGVWFVDTRLLNFTSKTSVSLTVTIFMSKCLYWDTELEKWRTEGCMVGDKSTPKLTHCLCNHLTLFGSSFFVMPNYVDISRTAELFATVNENYVVLALLCVFYGLYLSTLLMACYADRRASSKRKITLLEDNHPGAQYNYLIGVQTSHRKNAGTTANVTAKLVGTDGESTIHTLTDSNKPVFERGSFDMFLLATPFPLGDMRTLRLQHDNSGGNPSWYISKVFVQDLQSRNVWHFFCNCWLSADRGDGATKKTFNAAKNNEIASFRNIFQSRTSTGFRDEHIWVSIVDPPSRSPFTRAQRVSCCMCLLLCTMAINIAFWNIPVDESSPLLFSLGSLEITWQDFMVGIQCGLLMFPINILIITIFRKIRPRVVSKSKKDAEEVFKPPAVTMPAVLKETDEMISLLSMSPKNKMLEMPGLESSSDLLPAVDRIHIFIQQMQGESESNNHWVYCSKFLLASLCHLLLSLEKLDGKNFLNPAEYQQVLSLTSLLVRKAEMVLSSHLANCPPPVRKKKKASAGFRLPWWFVFIGWFLLLSISGISTYFTLLYGFQYGKEKSIKWVISLGLSLFESIFILQPLKVIGVAVVFALLLKPVAVEDTEEAEVALLEQVEKCRQYTGRETL
ncbi:polycystic kidney disease protein 1-like 2 [Kryptolebias marmoratus]|uniref:polycystic kidney disease protein 1-like 2 n=1 Tax=Kryptolebias marmoratus TaxID=37003 RepID=UPI0007F8AD56|nr:polycystic kidney disease protein 1-like 2 [Kryptolebias marmoratus]